MADYKPAAGRSNKIIVISLAAVLVLGIYAIGVSVTGYFSYSSGIESELNKTKEELGLYKAAGEECTRSLWSKEQNITACQGALSECGAKGSALNAQLLVLNVSLSSCLSESSGAKVALENMTARYMSLARNSVKAICCSFGDVQSSAVKSWDVASDRIVCSGQFAVNCSA